MFTNRRAPPKSPGSSISKPSTSNLTSSLPTSTTTTTTTTSTLSDRIKTQVRARPVIQTKVIQKTVIKQIPKPLPRPPPVRPVVKKLELNGKGKGKALNGNGKKSKTRPIASTSSSSSEESDSPSTSRKPSKPTSRAPKRSKLRHSHSSSLLSSLSGGEGGGGYESSSSLSSADEDYFSGKLGRARVAEGAAVCVREVAAKEEGGDMKVVSSEEVVRGNLDAYILNFFADPANPDAKAMDWCGCDLPVIELEYPAIGGKERFALLAPKRNDEYNPIEDLMVTIETILANYLTPSQSLEHFGYTPGSSFSSFSSFLKPLSHSHSSSTANPSSSSSSRSSSPAINHISTPKLSTPEPSIILSTSTTSSSAPPIIVAEPLLRALEKARNRRDGPTFFSHIAHFNRTLSSLKSSGLILSNIQSMRGLREKLWTKIFYQCYDRIVGPDIEELRKYAAFSDNVYGELLPRFMNEIFAKTDGALSGEGKVFVDLGSGVGNCVVQAALATGAKSYGFENMPHASHLARNQLIEAEKRFRLWGISGGEMECHESDFCEDSLVPKVLKKADVVLVNNEVFTAALNDKLAYLFLDLPDNCFLVSLKPFLPPSFKLSSHNLNHPLAYLSQVKQQYKPGSVSWKMEGGNYFIARVERGRLERWVGKQEEKEKERKRLNKERKERRGSSLSMSRQGSRQ